MTDRTPLASDFEAALDWWRDAGVDCDFSDNATTWLAKPEQAAEAIREAIPPPRIEQTTALDRALKPTKGDPIGGNRDLWPTDVASFREWWLSEPSLDDSKTSERIVSRGPAQGALMVIVGLPDEGDSDRLLSGEQGETLSAFLRAAGIDENLVYVASALPRRIAMPDWENLASRGLLEVTMRHVAVAKPECLVVFGRALGQLMHENQDDDSREPMLIAPSLENLARSAARKRRFWNNWLEWTSA